MKTFVCTVYVLTSSVPPGCSRRWRPSCVCPHVFPPYRKQFEMQTVVCMSSRLPSLQDAVGDEDVRGGRDVRVRLHLPQAARPRGGGRRRQVPAAETLQRARPARTQPLAGVRRQDGAPAAAQPHPGGSEVKGTLKGHGFILSLIKKKLWVWSPTEDVTGHTLVCLHFWRQNARQLKLTWITDQTRKRT